MIYDITLNTKMREWSEGNPLEKVVKVEMDKSRWAQYLIQRGTIVNGVSIHTHVTKWKYFKLILGTATLKGDEWHLYLIKLPTLWYVTCRYFFHYLYWY